MENSSTENATRSEDLSDEELEIIAADVEAVSERLKAVLDEVRGVVWGQDDIIELTLTSMIAGGNVLLEGLPGLAKTRFLQNLAPILSMEFKRVQFTPDLMPGDITGSVILDEAENGRKEFRFQKGPIFTQLFMADEINRAGPRTQSALLEAMQEKKVSVDGTSYYLQKPFHVVATQNPLEQDGTYPLPEAQLDRFLMKIDLDYPDRESEKRVMLETTSTPASKYLALKKQSEETDIDLRERTEGSNDVEVNAVLDKFDLIKMQELSKVLPLSESFVDAVLNIVRSARPNDPTAPDFVKEHVEWGPGPRAEQAFAQAARARALLNGRLTPDNDDIRALAQPILGHRMGVKFSARSQDYTEKTVIDELLKQNLDPV